MTARLVAGLALAVWLAGGLLITVLPAHPAPGQVVEHNLVPFQTVAIWVANPDSGFWIRQMLGNLLLLLPVGLLGPIPLPWMDRWWRVLLATFLLSLDRGRPAVDPRPRGRRRRPAAERCGSCPRLRDPFLPAPRDRLPGLARRRRLIVRREHLREPSEIERAGTTFRCSPASLVTNRE